MQLFTALIIQVSSSHYLIIFHCNNVSLSRKQCNYGCNLLSHIADENNVIIVLGYHNLLDLSFGNCQLHSFLSFVNWLPFVLLETLYFLLLLSVNSLQLFSFPAISDLCPLSIKGFMEWNNSSLKAPVKSVTKKMATQEIWPKKWVLLNFITPHLSYFCKEYVWVRWGWVASNFLFRVYFEWFVVDEIMA